MGFIGGELGYRLLKRFGGTGTNHMDGSAYRDKSKVEVLLGKDIWPTIADKVVIDFGCGTGDEAIEMALRGARKVIGIDIQEKWLQVARQRAAERGVSERCIFARTPPEPADVIVALDSFEHFADPAGVLQTMHGILKPDGCVLASFGPTWYHPLGGHLFSIFPWAHLIFTEAALIRWRSDFKTDGATRFHEVDGGLNQMTIKRFKHIVQSSPFEFAEFEAVPISKLKWLANTLTQEFTTAIIRCRLISKNHAPAAVFDMREAA